MCLKYRNRMWWMEVNFLFNSFLLIVGLCNISCNKKIMTDEFGIPGAETPGISLDVTF